MITVDHVTKYYGSHAAVRDLDFRIEEGECVGFLGLNGAGKTTTLRLLSCLLLPTSGRVTIRGMDAEEEPHEIRKLLGFLPDTPPLYPEMRVSQFLRYAGKLRRMEPGALEKRLPEVLDSCGLQEVADESIDTLSHGYRQRIGIAQAIVHEPTLLILDEPIQGLDPVQIVEMREMIRRLRGRHTILLSTHILSEIERTCDRILMLHQGRIAAKGTEEQLEARFAEGVGVEALVRGEEAKVREALGTVDGVTGLNVSGAEGGLLRVRFRGARDVREDAARALVNGGVGLLALQRSASGLEDIFVRLSRGEGGALPSEMPSELPSEPAATEAAATEATATEAAAKPADDEKAGEAER